MIGDCMSTEVINVVTREEGELKSRKVKAGTYEFTIATRAKWEMLISEEDTEIKAGEFKKIKVKEVEVEPDMVAMPCTFSHHAVVSVIKVGTKGGSKPVDKIRTINSAYILGQETGKVRKGDLLGVLNIFPIMFTREAMSPVEIE